MERKPSQRSLPLRLTCVTTGSRRIAKAFHFGEAVTADLTTIHQCVLSDGSNLHLLTLPAGRQDMLILNQAYVFKNLVLREGKAYFNDNSACFRSYPMMICPELMVQASHILLPPSPPVKIKDTRITEHNYFTVEGQVIFVTEVRQMRLKGSPIPIMELRLQGVGEDVLVALWREAALTECSIGDWLQITHARKQSNLSYAFKLNSSAYTTVTKIEAIVSRARVEETGALILTEAGVELKVPEWRGTEGEFLIRLPLTRVLDIKGDVVTSHDKLFEEQPTLEVEEEGALDEELDEGATGEELEGLFE